MTEKTRETLFTAARMAILALLIAAMYFIFGAEGARMFLMCLGLPLCGGIVLNYFLDREMKKEFARANSQIIGKGN